MSWRSMFRQKSIETLLAEMAGEQRLHRVLGPIALTSLGIGAIIGAGIFAMTGRVAAEDAGPAIMVSFIVAGVACAFAALCYSEFASMAPVAGSAYTYTYATLGEVWAWIIGWDLILEYSMACSVVAAHWTHYLDELLHITLGVRIPPEITSDPFTKVELPNGVMVQAYGNVPAMLIMALVTVVLVLGIRESVTTNAILVGVKVLVVLFVIAIGIFYINSDNWTKIPPAQRKASDVSEYLTMHPDLAKQLPAGAVTISTSGEDLLKAHGPVFASLDEQERNLIKKLPAEITKWGMLGVLGIKEWLQPLDDQIRSSFFPYGISGVMVGAALVFFAFIGFDSISTHAEEAVRPSRDVPIGILASLTICTVLYMAVAAVITGMEPYPTIDTEAAVAVAFSRKGEETKSLWLNASAGLIAAGALAGMTSVLLVTFLSQGRIFLAMARDGLLPKGIFGVVHPRFRTPHRSTILTGILIAITSGLFPIKVLGEMVSIGTLMAFALVCGSVMILRITRPEVPRPFRCPALFIVAPLGILVNVAMMLFLPLDTWLRLVIWLAAGLLIYFIYGIHHSTLGHNLEKTLREQGASPTNAPLE